MAQVSFRTIASSVPAPAVITPADALAPIYREGKFLCVSGEKFLMRGATYGPFAPDENGCQFGPAEQVERDFALMNQYGINTVRIYTLPPQWLLDLAASKQLRVFVGVPWEQHIAFLDDKRLADEIVEKVRSAVRACAAHPAVFCFAVGNEIPATIARWHGKTTIERFLKRLYDVAKSEAPDKLVTYVNYPSTEYLDLSFFDFMCFNVYLEHRDQFENYLARLQNLAESKPLVLAEIGLDSMRNGLERQAEVIECQIDICFRGGLAGIYLFAWTDEWSRGGHNILDWSFGLTTHDRQPKPALEAVSRRFRSLPFPPHERWPMVSVLICTHNGAKTIAECLEHVAALDYPAYEVIVVCDGSTDDTSKIVGRFPKVQFIALEENQGLSNARNVAAHAARGEIVAYIDDDAYPDAHWLKFLIHIFNTTDHAGVGGPNIPPPGAGWVADCVASAPGGPIHVLLTDTVAEHIPGCNMAFRRDALLKVGGFDKNFRIAGDDVDACWRLQDAGFTLGFSPAAVVWHHRRDSIGAYLRQQRNYGRAEAMLERKWPNKYNALGHVPWAGRIYGREAVRHFLPGRSRIYQGTWGLAPFQRIYEPNSDLFSALIRMPEWYLAGVGTVLLFALGFTWTPLLLAAPALFVLLGLPMLHAILFARDARFDPTSSGNVLKKRAVTGLLTLLQPLVRLFGRIEGGLTPWRTRGTTYPARPMPRTYCFWFENWQPYHEHLEQIQRALRTRGAVAHAGNDYSPWDLMVRGGLFGSVSCLMGVEEHGGGKQLVRIRLRPAIRRHGTHIGAFLVILGLLAMLQGSAAASVTLLAAAALLLLRAVYECGIAMAAVNETLQEHAHFVRRID